MHQRRIRTGKRSLYTFHSISCFPISSHKKKPQPLTCKVTDSQAHGSFPSSNRPCQAFYHQTALMNHGKRLENPLVLSFSPSFSPSSCNVCRSTPRPFCLDSAAFPGGGCPFPHRSWALFRYHTNSDSENRFPVPLWVKSPRERQPHKNN